MCPPSLLAGVSDLPQGMQRGLAVPGLSFFRGLFAATAQQPAAGPLLAAED